MLTREWQQLVTWADRRVVGERRLRLPHEQFGSDGYRAAVIRRKDTGATTIVGTEASASGNQGQMSLDVARTIGLGPRQRITIELRAAGILDMIRYGESAWMQLALAGLSVVATVLTAIVVVAEHKLGWGLALASGAVAIALSIVKVVADLRKLRP
jgi:hypothetical protein